MAIVYVASSWRNNTQPRVVEVLRRAHHNVYDFRNPPTSRCSEAFEADMTALQECDACVLVLPCGRSAHLELGWAVGACKRTAILLAKEGFEPELMYKMCDLVTRSVVEIVNWLAPRTQPRPAL